MDEDNDGPYVPEERCEGEGPFVSVQALLDKIRFYEAREKARAEAMEKSMLTLSDSTFALLTGFRTKQDALDAFEKAGGEARFDALRRVRAVPKLVVESSREPRTQRGRPPTIDAFHVFLVVFLYVHGGVYQFMAELLPGLFCSQAHFSRLLSVSLDVAVEHWVPAYYCDRSVEWLRENCGQHQTAYPLGRICGSLMEKLAKADVVILMDGTGFPSEKSQSARLQKQMYDYGKDEDHEARVLLICNRQGVILHVSAAVGGRTEEEEVASRLDYISHLNEKAKEANQQLSVMAICDQGFYWHINEQKGLTWSNVNVEWVAPHELDVPMRPGQHATVEQKAAKRKRFSDEEVEWNRGVAHLRTVSEIAVGGLKRCRLFQRVLDHSVLHYIDKFVSVAAALHNYHLLKAVPDEK